MVVTIETDRLVIRPVVPDDAEAIFKWASDPEVTKYMIYTTHPNAEYTRERGERLFTAELRETVKVFILEFPLWFSGLRT